MQIKRLGTTAALENSSGWFTGQVWIEATIDTCEESRVSGAIVTFSPGARTVWHTHPLGQTLIVTAGSGWIQQEGGPVQSIQPGDIIWIDPGERHWHGATRQTGMTHIAIHEAVEGNVANWMEPVTEAQYNIQQATEKPVS